MPTRRPSRAPPSSSSTPSPTGHRQTPPRPRQHPDAPTPRRRPPRPARPPRPPPWCGAWRQSAPSPPVGANSWTTSTTTPMRRGWSRRHPPRPVGPHGQLRERAASALAPVARWLPVSLRGRSVGGTRRGGDATGADWQAARWRRLLACGRVHYGGCRRGGGSRPACGARVAAHPALHGLLSAQWRDGADDGDDGREDRYDARRRCGGSGGGGGCGEPRLSQASPPRGACGVGTPAETPCKAGWRTAPPSASSPSACLMAIALPR